MCIFCVAVPVMNFSLVFFDGLFIKLISIKQERRERHKELIIESQKLLRGRNWIVLNYASLVVS
jgi:hypothetical protein